MSSKNEILAVQFRFGCVSCEKLYLFAFNDQVARPRCRVRVAVKTPRQSDWNRRGATQERPRLRVKSYTWNNVIILSRFYTVALSPMRKLQKKTFLSLFLKYRLRRSASLYCSFNSKIIFKPKLVRKNSCYKLGHAAFCTIKTTRHAYVS